MLQIWFFVIGLSVGLLVGFIRKGNASDIVGDMIVGVLGALVGGMIFGAVRLSGSFSAGSFMAAAGAFVFVAVAEMTKKM